MNVILRSITGVVALVVALLLRAAMIRLVSGVALLFGAAAALAVGVLLFGGLAVMMEQRWLQRRPIAS